MPRRRVIAKRIILPDPKFKDRLVAKFINSLMYQGKKGVGEEIFYDAMDIIADKTKNDPIRVFKKAMDNIKPIIEVKARRVGGSTYQVPIEVRSDRREALGIRWLIRYSRARGEKSMRDKLAGEIIDAFNGKGAAVKKREETHRMAEANKAFAHYRW
ncbi:MAG: 30S ribosomal protein S7 [Deltaproteobacteria bacterium]|jgi:small subunit ribosomal protein S7|nr:30S ribosomal protein S7 [Candidatus Zymogenaceae bacterium]